MSQLESGLNAYTTGIRFFFHGYSRTSQLNGDEARKNLAAELTSTGFRTRLVGIGDELRDDCPVSTWLFTVALTSIPSSPPSPLNDPKKERRSFEPFASFFFSRGTQQWWTEDGPDGRHGRCAAQTARTPGEDPVTSRHPATVDDLARGETPAWRIAPAACATVSHEILSHPLVTTLFDAPSGHTHVKKTPCCYRLYRKVDITVFRANR